MLWNSRSIIPKREKLETLLYIHNPDIVCITESWLSNRTHFELPNFITVRQDRPAGRGGGALIIVRIYFGSLALLGYTNDMLYAPPGGDIDPNTGSNIFYSLPHTSNHIFSEDFNARNTA